MTLATLYLEKYLAIATETKQSVAQVEAYSALGTIWSQQGQHDKAVSFFEKTFEIARTIGNQPFIHYTILSFLFRLIFCSFVRQQVIVNWSMQLVSI
jgi:tetratricopeptide (TPR) repeat protein